MFHLIHCQCCFVGPKLSLTKIRLSQQQLFIQTLAILLDVVTVFLSLNHAGGFV